MKTIWTLLETCIIPIINYSSEIWEPNKPETKRLNTILDNIIKRILRLPQSTPREFIYHELNIPDTQHRIIKRRINYALKLKESNPPHMTEVINDDNQKSWNQKNNEIIERIGLDINNLLTLNKMNRSKLIENKP